MKNYLKILDKIKYIFFISILLFVNNTYGLENKIIFKINNKSFTTIDYQNRLNYLIFIGDNKNIQPQVVIEDFISVNLFNEYRIKNKGTFPDEQKIKEIYQNIIDKNNENNLNKEIQINEDNILFNLKLDYLRKLILEQFLNEKRSEIFTEINEIDLLYKFNIQYINLSIENYSKIKAKIDENMIKNLIEIERLLIEKQIDYLKKSNEIDDINKINDKIKKNILSKNNFFILKNNNSISFLEITKNFETYEGLIANIYSIDSNIEIDVQKLKCEKLKKNKSDDNIYSKEYKYNQLNDSIKNKLLDIGDYIKFTNNDKYTYVVLCGIKFNNEILNNISINKKINIHVNNIEKKFIEKYKRDYNFILYD